MMSVKLVEPPTRCFKGFKIGCHGDVFNALGAMVALWHTIIVSFNLFSTKRVSLNFDVVDEMRT